VEASLANDAIYPILLKRAKHVSTQYDALVKKLSDRYDASTAKKAGELASVAQALKRWNAAKEVRSD
jgi:peptide chain release factor 1